MRKLFVVPIVSLTACAPSADFSGPAPSGALECALAHGLAAGYQRIAGSIEDGYLRLAQRLPPTPADEVITQPSPDLGDVVLSASGPERVENALLIQESRGRLDITVLGLSDESEPIGTGSTAEEQGRTILALCTATPPVFPDTLDG